MHAEALLVFPQNDLVVPERVPELQEERSIFREAHVRVRIIQRRCSPVRVAEAVAVQNFLQFALVSGPFAPSLRVGIRTDTLPGIVVVPGRKCHRCQTFRVHLADDGGHVTSSVQIVVVEIHNVFATCHVECHVPLEAHREIPARGPLHADMHDAAVLHRFFPQVLRWHVLVSLDDDKFLVGPILRVEAAPQIFVVMLPRSHRRRDNRHAFPNLQLHACAADGTLRPLHAAPLRHPLRVVGAFAHDKEVNLQLSPPVRRRRQHGPK
mmetsp:Transcript_67416/g.188108  ORF Transcript_67416/g.188108 Transcript_67416/m.188108 type:complete len:266 (+) Transcript_67416:363-1160(+)